MGGESHTYHVTTKVKGNIQMGAERLQRMRLLGAHTAAGNIVTCNSALHYKLMSITIFTDGGARGNPGPAGAGATIQKDGAEIGHVSKFLGTQTNNWAEYEALRLALQTAHNILGSPVTETVTVKMDSELIVKQMKGEYRVKDPELKKQNERVRLLILESFPRIEFVHVRRELNKRADQLANEAMDRKA